MTGHPLSDAEHVCTRNCDVPRGRTELHLPELAWAAEVQQAREATEDARRLAVHLEQELAEVRRLVLVSPDAITTSSVDYVRARRRLLDWAETGEL